MLVHNGQRYRIVILQYRNIIYMNFRERPRRKEVAFIDAFQRVTGWWEVMCQIVSEYIPELHTE